LISRIFVLMYVIMRLITIQSGYRRLSSEVMGDWRQYRWESVDGTRLPEEQLRTEDKIWLRAGQPPDEWRVDMFDFVWSETTTPATAILFGFHRLNSLVFWLE
jgi:hypothetical protein